MIYVDSDSDSSEGSQVTRRVTDIIESLQADDDDVSNQGVEDDLIDIGSSSDESEQQQQQLNDCKRAKNTGNQSQILKAGKC